MNFGKICQNYKSGLCLKGSACPFIHNTFKIDADENMGVKFKSTEINWGKKKKKQRVKNNYNYFLVHKLLIK